MAAAGVDVGLDLTDTSTIGWVDAYSTTVRLLSGYHWIRREIRRCRPRAVLVIDAPGLCLPVAKFAKSLGIPVVYYITPQAWMWDPVGAVEKLRARTDIVVPVLEAEADLYSSRGLSVVYHGNPIVDDLGRLSPGNGEANLSTSGANGTGGAGSDVHSVRTDAPSALAIAPGSRRHTIRRLLPAMLDAADIVRRRTDIRQIEIALADAAFRDDVERELARRSLSWTIIEDGLAPLLARSRVAMSASGGNLLEAVAADVPVVACYQIDPVSYAVADHVMHLKRRMPAFTIPNILAGEPVIPELIQRDVTPERIASHVVRLSREGPARQAVLDGYAEIRRSFGKPGVARRVAEEIVARLPLA